jgi:hypothetical protein
MYCIFIALSTIVHYTLPSTSLHTIKHYSSRFVSSYPSAHANHYVCNGAAHLASYRALMLMHLIFLKYALFSNLLVFVLKAII